MAYTIRLMIAMRIASDPENPGVISRVAPVMM
jgi:hypothetical protein